MKIIFTSSNTQSPSFLFYKESLAKIRDQYNEITIEIKDNPEHINYAKYDIALFMGFKDFSQKAKNDNPSILTGVVEPRIAQKNTFSYVDFIIVNSIEAKDYFSKFIQNIIIYYTFPEVPDIVECPLEKKCLILGYHGNRLHLDAMFPRIISAIESLNKEIPVELWAMYNIKTLGKWQKPVRNNFGFNVNHIQYSVENYAKFIAHVDIGLIPQFIPVKSCRLLRYLIGSFTRKYNEQSEDYFLRFKETTNIGRHLVFAQYNIPVVCDMSPSSAAFIEDEIDGFLASSTQGWLRGLKKLALNEKLRSKMGNKLNSKYNRIARHEIQNDKLTSFLNNLISNKR